MKEILVILALVISTIIAVLISPWLLIVVAALWFGIGSTVDNYNKHK